MGAQQFRRIAAFALQVSCGPLLPEVTTAD
jgi:hypothetical protein